MTAPRLPSIDRTGMRPIVQARVLFADTDQMGIVYHASYLRYLEHARVELCRAAGLEIPLVGSLGFGLPVVELAVRYLAPARYDDNITVHAAITALSRARLHFQYVVTVEPGDRRGLDRPLELLWAETRHACVRLADGKLERLPAEVVALLESCYARR